MKRWKIAFTFMTRQGPRTKYHYIEELEELQDYLEGDVDFRSIVDIRITYELREGDPIPCEDMEER